MPLTVPELEKCSSKTKQGVRAHTSPSTQGAEAEDLREFEANLVYVASSKIAKATQ